MLEPTRNAGLERLAAFVPRAGRDYAAGRNHDNGPGSHTAVSVLSPYIRHRLLTEAEVAAHVLQRHSPVVAEKFLQEVCWRTYWKGWLEMRPAVWQRYRRETRRLHERGGDWQPAFRAATTAATGIACFDGWVRELTETGYLHNHARMWFASIWLYTLTLPWQLGADFFLRMLVDGDAASNTLSWRWVGGLQTRGKTYLARPDNIARYTGGRFGPVTGLADAAPPLPWDDPPAPNDAFRTCLPDPALSSVVVMSDDDLTPWHAISDVDSLLAVALVTTSTQRSPLELGPAARAFSAGALDDAAQRVAQRNGVAVTRLAGADVAEPVVAWAKQTGARQVIVPYAPVGPSADALAALPAALKRAGLRYANPLRAWDEAAWPHARKGFFPFRKHIPDLLALAEADPV